jgi:cysteinyl-tRNA synthetase
MEFTLYNSLSRTTEPFVPIHPPNVGMYTCGMTVYDYAHIGHGRKYVGDDILRRTLTRFGYNVTHVQNITDVGHLVSDADTGEDKLEKGAKKQGSSVWEVARFFTKHFYDSMDRLNVLRPTIICRATDHIPEQIALVKRLMDKGFAYDTTEAIYFDVSKFSKYESLFGNQLLAEKQIAVRDNVKTGKHKKHNTDFVLWFKRVGKFADHLMHWPSPWGEGFPGWHIECSAMSMKYLGDTFDIHTGGIDHLTVHHPNEIAQSEAATGKPFVRYWIHYTFLMVDGKKMSKSLGNMYTVGDIMKRNFDPLALRYFFLTAHYRKAQNFTWEGLTAAQNSLSELRKQLVRMRKAGRTSLSEEKMEKVDAYRLRFDETLADDMNTPQALATVWEVVKSNIPSPDKYDLLVDFDKVLGLKLNETGEMHTQEIPAEIRILTAKREELRAQKKFSEADSIRKTIESKGYILEDTPTGTLLSRS